jgi:23S rRNA pseudouridine2605 synthase
MNDQASKDPNQNAGVYAKRKPGEMTQALQVSFKPIALADVVSGQFDEEEGAEPLSEDLGKRVLAPQSDSPKLHKVLAQAGMGLGAFSTSTKHIRQLAAMLNFL